MRFVLRFFCDRLIQSCLERPRIDHRQEITRFHILPFGEQHLLQFAIHAGVHRDGVERLDRPEAIEVDRRIFLLDLSRDHRHRAAAGSRSAASSRSSCCGG